MARIDLTRIRELIRVAVESGAAEVEIEEKGIRILVRKHPASAMVMPATYGLAPPQAMVPQPAYAPQILPSPAGSVPSIPTRAEEEPASEPEGILIRAPIVGTFFRQPAPDADPFVEVGTNVNLGDTLCIIEAMKTMNEIKCEAAGKVMKVMVQDGDPVSYDQPLFVLA